jgi:hypothetical protein
MTNVPNFAQLTRALADALRPILPTGISVSADDRYVLVHTRHGYDWLPVVDNVEANLDECTSHEAIEGAVYTCINVVQDVVTEHLTEPWPHPPGAPRCEFADYGVEVRDGILSIWFGRRDAPLFPVVQIELR